MFPCEKAAQTSWHQKQQPLLPLQLFKHSQKKQSLRQICDWKPSSETTFCGDYLPTYICSNLSNFIQESTSTLV